MRAVRPCRLTFDIDFLRGEIGARTGAVMKGVVDELIETLAAGVATLRDMLEVALSTASKPELLAEAAALTAGLVGVVLLTAAAIGCARPMRRWASLTPHAEPNGSVVATMRRQLVLRAGAALCSVCACSLLVVNANHEGAATRLVAAQRADAGVALIVAAVLVAGAVASALGAPEVLPVRVQVALRRRAHAVESRRGPTGDLCGARNRTYRSTGPLSTSRKHCGFPRDECPHASHRVRRL